MTDLSSNDQVMADLAGDVIAAKMDAGKMTHLLRIGTFQMEVAPNDNLDIREFFNETIDKLISAYGEKLLEIDINTATMQGGNMHG